MVFSCFSHIFINLTAPTVPKPTPTHTGLIHRAALPQNPPSTFPPAPNAPTTAFDPSLVSGAADRQRMKELFSRPKTPEENEAIEVDGRGEDGTSWEQGVRDVDGWNVGWERATQMFVKRKGRGKFRFEDAMVEGWSVGLREGEKGNEEVVDKVEKLEDGFKHRDWVDEEMEKDTQMESKDVDEREMVVKSVESRDDVNDEIEAKRRDGIDGRRTA